MKLIISLMFLTSTSVFAYSNVKDYLCTGEGHLKGLGTVKSAEIEFVKGSLRPFHLVWVNFLRENQEARKITFKGSQKLKEESEELVFIGEESSTLNPFGDFEKIALQNFPIKVTFEELPVRFDIVYSSSYGPVGNRGSDRIQLSCTRQN